MANENNNVNKDVANSLSNTTDYTGKGIDAILDTANHINNTSMPSTKPSGMRYRATRSATAGPRWKFPRWKLLSPAATAVWVALSSVRGSWAVPLTAGTSALIFRNGVRHLMTWVLPLRNTPTANGVRTKFSPGMSST